MKPLFSQALKGTSKNTSFLLGCSFPTWFLSFKIYLTCHLYCFVLFCFNDLFPNSPSSNLLFSMSMLFSLLYTEPAPMTMTQLWLLIGTGLSPGAQFKCPSRESDYPACLLHCLGISWSGALLPCENSVCCANPGHSLRDKGSGWGFFPWKTESWDQGSEPWSVWSKQLLSHWVYTAWFEVFSSLGFIQKEVHEIYLA